MKNSNSTWLFLTLPSSKVIMLMVCIMVVFVKAESALAIEIIWDAELAPLEEAPKGKIIAYGDGPLQFGELHLPSGPGPFPVVAMVHGGCWLPDYDYAHMRSLAVAIRDSGFAVWNIEYARVGNPGGGWPGTFLDVAAGADYLRKLSQDYPLDLDQVVALGHSAGGHLATWLAVRPKLTPNSDLYDADPLPLKGVLAMAPALEIEFVDRAHYCGDVVNGLMGGSPQEVPERYRDATPNAHIPLGIPHTIFVGDYDGIGLLGLAYYHTAAEAGDKLTQLVEAPESGHFEMIDPKTNTWPLVLDALRALFD
jgi:acetyl esterase/lipase